MWSKIKNAFAFLGIIFTFVGVVLMILLSKESNDEIKEKTKEFKAKLSEVKETVSTTKEDNEEAIKDNEEVISEITGNKAERDKKKSTYFKEDKPKPDYFG